MHSGTHRLALLTLPVFAASLLAAGVLLLPVTVRAQVDIFDDLREEDFEEEEAVEEEIEENAEDVVPEPATPVTPAPTTPAPTAPVSPSPSVIPNEVQPTQPNPAQPQDPRPLAQERSILSLAGGNRLMTEASQAIAAQDYTLAIEKLQQARQVFNQLSNFYQELSASFSGIDNRISEENRRKAADAAQMRDEATYQLALVHRAENKPELAVPLLIQIVRSQQPTRDLGQKAYQQLLELGFVDSQFPRTGG